MKPRWDESEFVFGDLQTVAQFIHHDNPTAARLFLEAAYDAFEFLARNPGVGRQRADLGFPEIRSWRIQNFRRYLIFYRELPDEFKSGASFTARAIWKTLFVNSITAIKIALLWSFALNLEN